MELKEIRQQKKLTQKEASKFLNIPLRTYKRYESKASKDSIKYSYMKDKLTKYKNSNDFKKKEENKNIFIFGAGYVGLSLSCLLSQKHHVTLVDINKEKINLINNKKCPFKDKDISYFLTHKKLDLFAKNNIEGISKADFIIICTPTDFNSEQNYFDTSSVESVIEQSLKNNKRAQTIIKSTIPIGFCDKMNEKFNVSNICFSPEFLKEGSALKDNLYPSRIILGGNKTNKNKEFAYILNDLALGSLNDDGGINLNKKPEILFMSNKEAEAVKLFSNAYLAMRVAFFNELDSYAIKEKLVSKNIIQGVCDDPRIGNFYNNPSFGYGGYCLPKDTKQLKSTFSNIGNNNLVNSIVSSNQTRKEFIADDILKFALENSHKNIDYLTIGIYKLSMKKDSDNMRSSSTLDIKNILINKGAKVIVFDPNYDGSVNDFKEFIDKSDVILTNRLDKNLKPYINKIYTRDQFFRD